MSRPAALSSRDALQKFASTRLADITGLGNVQTLADGDAVPVEMDVGLYDSGSGGTVTLPAISQAIVGKVYRFKQLGAGALTIEGFAAETIDGSANAATGAQYDEIAMALLEGQTQWLVVGGGLLAGGDIPAGAITNAKMAANAIDSDQYVDGSIDAEHLAANSVDSDSYVDGSIDPEHLAAGLDAGDLGQPAVAHFYLTSTAGDTELVTLNGRTYEFDDDAASTGDVAVDISGDATADAAITALVAAVNGDGSAEYDAVAWTGNADTGAGCTFVEKVVGGSDVAISTDAANGAVSAATTSKAAAIADKYIWAGEHTVLAGDVTALALTGGNEVPIFAVSSTTEPTLVGLTLRTSAGAMRPFTATMNFRIVQANSNFWALVVEDSAAEIATGDVIGFTLRV